VFRRTAWNIRQWPLATCPKVSAVGSDTALPPWHTHPRDRISYRDRTELDELVANVLGITTANVNIMRDELDLLRGIAPPEDDEE
jgi:hypothetical protein